MSNYINYNRRIFFFCIILISLSQINTYPILNTRKDKFTKTNKNINEYKNMDLLHKSDFQKRILKSFEQKTIDSCKIASDDLNKYFEGKKDLEKENISNKKSKTTERILDSIDNINRKDNIIDYIEDKRIIIPLIFIFFSVILIIIWILFISNCCCCFCCCCCCCRRSWKCQTYSFILALIFIIISLAGFINGLISYKEFFEGFGDISCSMNQFFNILENGEIKETLPRWVGINKMNKMLTSISDEYISKLNETYTDLNYNNGFNSSHYDFIQQIVDCATYYCEMNNKPKYFLTLDNSTYAPIFLKEFCPLNYSDSSLSDNDFNFTNSENSFFYRIKLEYISYMKNINKVFDSENNAIYELISNPLDLKNASDKIVDIKQPLKKIKENFADKFSELIIKFEDNGKKVYIIFFSLLCGLLLLIFIFSFSLFINRPSKKYKNKKIKLFGKPGPCRSIASTFIHIFWNILMLLLIFSFFIGGFLWLISNISSDMVDVVSYIISDENLKSDNPRIVSKSPGTEKLNICINEDGNLKSEMGLNLTVVDNLNEITKLRKDLKDIKSSKLKTINEISIFNKTSNEFKNRQDIQRIYYNFTSNGNEINESNITSIIRNISDIIDALFEFDNNKNTLPNIGIKYEIVTQKIESFLNTSLSSLASLEQYLGDESGTFYDLINCKFAGTNIKVFLHLLKNKIGKNFFYLGLFLCISSLSSLFAIGFILLFLYILKQIELDEIERYKSVNNVNLEKHPIDFANFENEGTKDYLKKEEKSIKILNQKI